MRVGCLIISCFRQNATRGGPEVLLPHVRRAGTRAMTESEKEAAAMVARQRAAIKAAEQVRRKPRCRRGCVHLLNKLPPAPPQRPSGSPYPTESHVRTECHGRRWRRRRRREHDVIRLLVGRGGGRPLPAQSCRASE